MADWRRLQEKIQQEQEQERQRAEQLREQQWQEQIFREAEEVAHRQRQWREWRLVNREAVDAYRQVRDDNMRRELQREQDRQRQREEDHQRELQRLQELNRQREVDRQREIERLSQQLETGARLKQKDDKKKN